MNTKGKKTGKFKAIDGKSYTIIGLTRMMMDRVSESVKASWEIVENRPLPKRPTYEDEGLGGEKVIYYHTPDTLETEEEKKAWEEYESAQKELDARTWKQMMYEAMNCVVVPMKDLKAYASEQEKRRGVAMPDPEKYEERVKRIYVTENILFDDTDEMMRLLTETMRVAGVISNEEAANAMQSFRNSQAEPGGESTKRQDTAESAGDS